MQLAGETSFPPRYKGSQRGSVSLRLVGPPGGLWSSNVPPAIRTRSAMPTSPSRPRCGGLGERALDLEAHAVVGDLHLDRAPAGADLDDDRGRGGVLADVGERLLDRAEDGDPLAGGQRVRVSADLEHGRDSRALRERVDLAVEDLAERAADDALRLERVRELAKLAVELDESGREVVEAPVRLLAVALEHERIDLLLEQADVGAECEHVLDGAVVEVEPESHQPPLAGSEERLLARRRVLEQLLALDHGPERGRRLGEERVRDLRPDRRDAADDARRTAGRTG